MSRRFILAVLLGAFVTAGSALPGHGLVPRAAAASCSGWTSNSVPPPTIRVFRHASGNVETVDFRAYTKNVLSREWIASWTTESLRSGALAVRNYAWYQVLHWRGGTNAGGQCFDLRDDTWDQVYDPSRPTYSTAAAAVDATWVTLVLKAGAIFPTYYNAGAAGEACGANANGWKAFQWGTQACGLAGMTASQIIQAYYYPGVTVSGAGPATTPSPPPSPPPTPSPSQSPFPTVAPTQVATATSQPTATAIPTAPSGASASPSATQVPSATPAATLPPTPAPTQQAAPQPTATPAPLPTPPLDQQLPGGGQASVQGAVAPPAPPPANPEPVIASPDDGVGDHPSPGTVDLLRWSAALRRLAQRDEIQGMEAVAFRLVHLEAGMHGGAVASRTRLAASNVAAPAGDLRLAAFRLSWDRALDALVAALNERVQAVVTAARGP